MSGTTRTGTEIATGSVANGYGLSEQPSAVGVTVSTPSSGRTISMLPVPAGSPLQSQSESRSKTCSSR